MSDLDKFEALAQVIADGVAHIGFPRPTVVNEPNRRAAAAVLAAGYVIPEPPIDDEREALELWSFEHRPIISMRDGSIASCKCMDRVFINGHEDWDQHIADSIMASPVWRNRGRGPISAEATTAADEAYVIAMQRDPRPWFAMRAALEAARDAEAGHA